MLYKVGVDLGGTKTEIIVLDENLHVLERKRVVTPQNNYDEIINTIETLVLDVSKNISDFSLAKTNMYVRLNDVQFNRNDALGDNRKTFAAEPEDEFDGERNLESCRFKLKEMDLELNESNLTKNRNDERDEFEKFSNYRKY